MRTLRYYDKVGLLAPSHYTQAGYRLYTDQDLLCLQQILALKFLGLALEEIRAYLRAEPQSLREALAQQKVMLQEKRSQLDSVIQTIDETEKLLQTNQCTWEALTKVIQVMQMEQNKDWVKKYFTDAQRQTMDELAQKAYTDEASAQLKQLHPGEWTAADQQRVDEQYAFVKTELTRLTAAGADPASPEAQNVARIKHELNFGFAQGNAEIEGGVKRWWENFEALPAEQRPFDTSVYSYSEEETTFLNKALEIYREQQKN